MKKSFFSLHATTQRSVLHTTAVFSFMLCAPLNGMLGPEGRYLIRILNKGVKTAQLSPVQACYMQRGKEAFLQDLSKGKLESDDVQHVARLFTRKPSIHRDDYMRGFLANVNNMKAIRDASRNIPGYQPVIDQLTKELEEDSFDFVQIAVGVDAEAVSAVVAQVPSILNRPITYYHGYGTRNGTLLNYVEDELSEESDFDRCQSLRSLLNDLRVRGAKTLSELDKKK